MFETGLVLVPIASLVFLFSIYFAAKLYGETGREKFWFFLMVAALAFAFHEWIKIPWFFGLLEEGTFYLVMSLGDLIGGLSLAYAAFGLYKSMKEIRMKMSQKLGEE